MHYQGAEWGDVSRSHGEKLRVLEGWGNGGGWGEYDSASREVRLALWHLLPFAALEITVR